MCFQSEDCSPLQMRELWRVGTGRLSVSHKLLQQAEMQLITAKQDLSCLQNLHAFELVGDIPSNSANYLTLKVTKYSLELL